MDRDDVAPVAHQRLVDGQEVADRGLRGGRQRVGGAQAAVERSEVDDVRLALGAVAVVDVQADLADAELGDGLPRQVMRGVGDHRDVRHPGTLDNHRDDDPGHRGDGSRRVARHAPAGGARRRRAGARARALAARRARRPRRGARPRRRADRASVRRAMRGVQRVFHIAGLTSLRASADQRLRGQRRWHADRARGGAARRRGARGAHVVGGRGGPRGARLDGRRGPGLPRRALRAALRQRQARGRARGDAHGRARAAGGGRQPRARVRRRRPPPLLDRARAALPARPDPRLRRRRAQHRRRRGRRPRPPAGRRARRGGRALHPRQPQLHPRSPLRRPRPAVGRRAAGAQAARWRPRSRSRAPPSWLPAAPR